MDIKHYKLVQGQLLRKGKLVIGSDPEMGQVLLKCFHDSALRGHSGIQATSKDGWGHLLEWVMEISERLCEVV